MRDWIERPDPVTVLDVRSPAEFETARLPGSINVPLILVADHAGALAAGRSMRRSESGNLHTVSI